MNNTDYFISTPDAINTDFMFGIGTMTSKAAYATAPATFTITTNTQKPEVPNPNANDKNKKKDIRIRVKGKDVILDTPPILNRSNHTMLPVRFISEQLGAIVKWEENGQTNTVTITKGEITISMKLGESFALVNGNKKALIRPAS